MSITKQSTSGFTLVELAIVMTIIGLLIGGILKGQELLNNARLTSTIAQLKSYDAAATAFRDKYEALPGDIANPGERLSDCTAAICNIGGNGDGKIRWADTATSGIEIYNFFPHLVKAGFIQGVNGGTQEEMDANTPETAVAFFPQSKLVGKIVMSGEYYEMYSATCRQGSLLDTKIDDGNPDTGIVRDAGGDCHMTDTNGALIYNIEERHCDLELTANF